MSIQDTKAAVRARDGKCRKCGVTNEQYIAETGRSLDVHRRIPASKYTLDGCVTLCQTCHKSSHHSGEFIDGEKGSVEGYKTEPFTFKLPDSLREQIKKLSERNASIFTREVIIAIRERLERNELWPPPQSE